jgi:hypothetical protein
MLTDWPGGQSMSRVGQGVREASYSNSCRGWIAAFHPGKEGRKRPKEQRPKAKFQSRCLNFKLLKLSLKARPCRQLSTPSGRGKVFLPRIAGMLTDWPGGQSMSRAGQGVREASHSNSCRGWIAAFHPGKEGRKRPKEQRPKAKFQSRCLNFKLLKLSLKARPCRQLSTPSGRAKGFLPRIAGMLTDWPGGQSMSRVGQGVREASHSNSCRGWIAAFRAGVIASVSWRL